MISFDEWIAIITTFDTDQEPWDAPETIHELPPLVLAEYLGRLLTNASEFCKGISPSRLARLIWFFHGICSSYWHEIRSPEVPKEVQVSTARALGSFYRDFLDTYPLGRYADATEAETAVYMMGDMDCLEGAAKFPGEEHLMDSIFEVLEVALKCQSFACQRSALHGLGHLVMYAGDRPIRLIDEALKVESQESYASSIDRVRARSQNGMHLVGANSLYVLGMDSGPVNISCGGADASERQGSMVVALTMDAPQDGLPAH